MLAEQLGQLVESVSITHQKSSSLSVFFFPWTKVWDYRSKVAFLNAETVQKNVSLIQGISMAEQLFIQKEWVPINTQFFFLQLLLDLVS